jgi:hypothetical protein
MKNDPDLPRTVALAILGVIVFLACVPGHAQQPPSTVFRTTLLELTAGSYSYSTRSDLSRQGVVGSVAVQHAEMSLSARHELAPELQLAYGLSYDTNYLTAEGAVPLPDQVSVLSLNLGLIRTLNSSWTIACFARPGLFSDFDHLGSSSLSMPVLFTANFTPRSDLAWTLGLSLDRLSQNVLLPVLGLRWHFAPTWEFSLGFPHTGLTWQANRDLALRADAGFLGGSYHVMASPDAALRAHGTLLDYREIRAGVGLDYKLAEAFTFSLDAGAVADRRFDYHKLNYRLRGDSAAFVKASFSAHF